MKLLKIKGYTLVEILLYVSLFVILLVTIVNIGILLSKTYKDLVTAKTIQMNAISAMDQMTRYIREAESVDGTETVYNSSAGASSLRNTDSLGAQHTTKFYQSGNAVMMNKDGAVFGPLTSTRNSTSVSSLVFRPITTPNSIGVKIEMTISGKNFYQTVMLRGSYQ